MTDEADKKDDTKKEFNPAFINAKVNRAKKGKPEEHGSHDSAHSAHNRLPPGQTLTERWPILDLGVRPKIDLKNWRLEISGLVENPVTLTWEDFMRLPQALVTADMHCVTTWSKFDNGWLGVKFLDLVKLVRPKPEAKFIIQYGYDGYTTNAPLADFMKDNVLVAHSHDGAPLQPEHGGPARMIIPELYAWKGSKFIKKLEFVGADQPGFWEVRGYNNHGDPWTEERYS